MPISPALIESVGTASAGIGKEFKEDIKERAALQEEKRQFGIEEGRKRDVLQEETRQFDESLELEKMQLEQKKGEEKLANKLKFNSLMITTVKDPESQAFYVRDTADLLGGDPDVAARHLDEAAALLKDLDALKKKGNNEEAKALLEQRGPSLGLLPAVKARLDILQEEAVNLREKKEAEAVVVEAEAARERGKANDEARLITRENRAESKLKRKEQRDIDNALSLEGKRQAAVRILLTQSNEFTLEEALTGVSVDGDVIPKEEIMMLAMAAKDNGLDDISEQLQGLVLEDSGVSGLTTKEQSDIFNTVIDNARGFANGAAGVSPLIVYNATTGGFDTNFSSFNESQTEAWLESFNNDLTARIKEQVKLGNLDKKYLKVAPGSAGKAKGSDKNITNDPFDIR